VSERPDVRFLALSGTGQRHPHWSAMGETPRRFIGQQYSTTYYMALYGLWAFGSHRLSEFLRLAHHQTGSIGGRGRRISKPEGQSRVFPYTYLFFHTLPQFCRMTDCKNARNESIIKFWIP
jgi:hypothetical protein